MNDTRDTRTTSEIRRSRPGTQSRGSQYGASLTRRDFRSTGRARLVPCLKFDRLHHLFSDGEFFTLLLLEFDPNIIEIREQFEHVPLTESVVLAAELGIRHPMHLGTMIPMTTDFLVTRLNGHRGMSDFSIEVKDRTQEEKRDLEKIELRRVWWTARDVPFHLVLKSDLNRTVVENLQWVRSGVGRNTRVTARLEKFVKRFESEWAEDRPANDVLAAAAPKMSKAEQVTFLREAIWLHLINVELTRPIWLNEPITISELPHHGIVTPW